MKIIDSIKSELNKVSGMDKDKKWDYFKTYYLKGSIVVAILLILFIWFVKDVFFQKEGACMGCVYGVELTDEEKYILMDGYLDYFELNPRKYSAFVSTDNMFENTEQQMDANSHEMALIAQIAAGEIYYLILDKDILEMYSNSGIYSTLDEVLEEELIAELKAKDMVVNLTDSDSLKEYPTAIDLKKLGFIKEDYREAYLVFTIARPDDDFPKRFLNYLRDVSK